MGSACSARNNCERRPYRASIAFCASRISSGEGTRGATGGAPDAGGADAGGSIICGAAMGGRRRPGGTRITNPHARTSAMNLPAMRRGMTSSTVYTRAFIGRGGGNHRRVSATDPSVVAAREKHASACGGSFAASFAMRRAFTVSSICPSSLHALCAAAFATGSMSHAPRANVVSNNCTWSLIIACSAPICARVNSALGSAGPTITAVPVFEPGPPARPGAVPFFAAAAAAAASALSRALRVTTVDHTGRSLYSGRSSFDWYRYTYSLRFVWRFCGSGSSVAAARMGAFAAWYRRARRSTRAALGSTFA